MEKADNLTIAAIVDYENFNNEKYLKILFEYLDEMGDVVVKEAHYSNHEDKKFTKKAIQFGFVPNMSISYSSGKNSTDINIALRVMELLDKEFINCYCLATSDLDFAPIVQKLKQENKYVIGAGLGKTAQDYKNLCDDFINVDEILAVKEAEEKQAEVDEKTKATKASKNANKKAKQSAKYKEIIDYINKIIEDNKNQEGYANLAKIMTELKKKYRDFNPLNYGAKSSKPKLFFKETLSAIYDTKLVDTNWLIKKK